MTSFALLTAVYDGYDTLKPLPAFDVPVETICITDGVGIDLPIPAGWDRVELERRPGVHPNRAAKRPKCCPWEYTDAAFVVWIDASIQVTSPAFVREACAYAAPIAQFVHPARDCIYDEAVVSLGMTKYAAEPIVTQMGRYRELGHPHHWGLWATGISARRHTAEVEAFGKAWLDEIDRHSFQDQLSQAPILREHALRPSSLPGGYFSGQNPWLGYDGSGRH